MAGTLSRFDSSASRTVLSSFGALAAAGLGRSFDLYKDSECLVAICGSVRFPDPALASSARHHGLAATLAHLYSSKGRKAVAELSGSFALAILDGREALLATDRMGVHPVFYHAVNGTLVFGSTIDAITAFPNISPDVSCQAIYNYIYFHMIPAPDTIYTEVRRLLPGECLRFSGGNVQTEQYWQMHYVEKNTRALPELKEQFFGILRASVQDHQPVG